MKKITAILTACALFVLVVVSCAHHTAKKDPAKVRADRSEAARETAAADWLRFKHAADTALAGFENQVNEMEKNLAKSRTRDQAALQQQLNKNRQTLQMMRDQLKMKNKEFEQEMKQFDQSVSNRNKAFQREFDHDMKEFETAFKDLFKNNVK